MAEVRLFPAVTDRKVMFVSANLPPSALDDALRRLSTAANHSGLWISIAGGLALAGGRPRRAAVRGLLSVAAASALANGALKPLLPRRRPPAGTPEFTIRRGLPVPRSSSFPSGHAASAAAFATGVAIEYPPAGIVLAPLAAAVAYSRVHTGVHWPSDVVAGAAVGAAIAFGTRRWWAVRTEEPATLGPNRSVAALPDGAGMIVFVNASSGSDDGDREDVERHLPALRIVELDTDTDTDFADQIDTAVAEYRPHALGVCGGDGTVVTVASAAHRHDLPLAVFPGGTLNHFARDAGVGDIESTAHAITAGTAELVDLGQVTADGSPLTFVNTASLGGYPDVVRLREKWEPRLGKWPAAALAMIRVLASAQPLPVTIDGAPHAIWMLFVGNGRYSPADQVPMSRPEIHRGVLDVRYLLADHRWSRVRLLCAAATGTLGSSRTYVQRWTDAVAIRVTDEAVALATDGEVIADGRRFEFRSAPQSVALYRRE